MKKLTLGVLSVVLLSLSSCEPKFRGCGIVREKYISNAYYYIVLELPNSSRIIIGGNDPIENLSGNQWANARIGEKYCQ